jgi:hypothetical protein
MTKESIEGMLTKIALDFDREYFNGAGLVIGVKFARFYWDWKSLGSIMSCVTFGLYDSSTRVIYLNAYFHKMLVYGLLLREAKAVIFHELCHGVLLNSLTPLRLGMYDMRGDGHGPEFRELERRYSNYLTNEAMSSLAPEIIHWMRLNVPKELRRKKEA